MKWHKLEKNSIIEFLGLWIEECVDEKNTWLCRTNSKIKHIKTVNI